MKTLAVDFIKDCTVGRWSEVIRALAPQLATTVDRGRRHGPCDLCGGKDRCRCHNDFAETGGIFCNQCDGGADGFAVLCWANDWTFTETLEAVSKYLSYGTGGSYTATKAKSSQPKDWTGEHKKIKKLWDESKSTSIRLVEYFKHRGLSVELPPTLRFHHALFHYPSKEYFPAIIAQIIKGNFLVGLHRTFLDPCGYGKAPVSNPKLSKKCVESMSGGAIQLFDPEPDKPLVLCEGIETGLAVYEFTNWPVWSCVSSSMLEKVLLPDEIENIYIASDKDRSGAGEYSSQILARRLIGEGRRVKISLPPSHIQEDQTSLDWLDQLRKESTHA
jgi:putative DNA primase/helicase